MMEAGRKATNVRKSHMVSHYCSAGHEAAGVENPTLSGCCDQLTNELGLTDAMRALLENDAPSGISEPINFFAEQALTQDKLARKRVLFKDRKLDDARGQAGEKILKRLVAYFAIPCGNDFERILVHCMAMNAKGTKCSVAPLRKSTSRTSWRRSELRWKQCLYRGTLESTAR